MRGTQRKITDEIEGEGERNWEEEGDGWRENQRQDGRGRVMQRKCIK